MYTIIWECSWFRLIETIFDKYITLDIGMVQKCRIQYSKTVNNLNTKYAAYF